MNISLHGLATARPLWGPLALGTALLLVAGCFRSRSAQVLHLDVAGQAPVIMDFSPKTGRPGERINVSGQHLSQVTEVRIGGQLVASFQAFDDSELWVWATATQAVSGPITVTSALGSASSALPFVYAGLQPGITGIWPRLGGVGSLVAIQGSNLKDPSSITFGGVAAPDIRSSSDTEIRVAVPAGARTGPVTVVTAYGETRSPGSFRVMAGADPLDIEIAGLYLTQATQRLDGSVPLVAGRDAMLRVFLQGDQPNTISPPVKVTFLDASGRILLTETIRRAGGTPVLLAEGDLSQSWNLVVPGDILRPGLRVLAEMLPVAGFEPSGAGLTYPWDGQPLALQVETVPPIAFTLIPVRSAGGSQGQVLGSGRTLASWVERFKAIYPVQEVQVNLAPTYTTAQKLDDGIFAYLALGNELEVLRLRDDPGSRAYHYGVYERPYNGSVLGMGQFPPSPGSNLNRTAVGADLQGRSDGQNYPELFAHEVGHLLDRRHAPCGTAGGPDKHYPYPKGQLGAFGFQLGRNQSFAPEEFSDVMGYCSPQWVSDYTYKGVLAFRAKGAQVLAAADLLRQPQKGLLVWGTIQNGVAVLEPAYEVAGVSTPPAPGPYTLRCLDDQGGLLQELSFQAEPSPDLPEGMDLRSFAFVIPLSPELEAGLARLELRRENKSLATRGASSERQIPLGAAAGGAALAQAEPVAVAQEPDTVRLTWDARAYPGVIVKDPATGANLAMAQGGSMEIGTRVRVLELILSNGLRTVTRRVRVAE